MANDQLLRNLIFVSLTRALDHLNLFIPEGTAKQAYLDLVACFNEVRTEQV